MAVQRDRNAGFYNDRWGEQLSRQLADRTIPLAEPSQVLVDALRHAGGETAIDIGCGGGRNLFYLAYRGFTVTGIDTSEVAIKALSEISTDRGIRNVTFAVSDVEAEGIKGKYDFVLSSFMIQHIGFGKSERDQEAAKLKFVQDMMNATLDGGHNLVMYFSRGVGPDGIGSGEKLEGVVGTLEQIYQSAGWSVVDQSVTFVRNYANGLAEQSALLVRKNYPTIS